MNPLAAKQLDNNAQSRLRWDLFHGHRARVTELLRGAAGGRLCVLGAGNGNDLNLPTLLASFGEVHLVDLDAGALEYGAAHQDVADRPTLVRHGNVDVTGVLPVLSGGTPAAVIHDADLLACIEQPLRAAAPLPGPFDVVASVGLLSQLLLSLTHSVGRDHPRYLELVFAIRAGHLNLLLHLLRPGGTGFLITDFVSSETVPNLAALGAQALPHLARTQNFFDGLNPYILEALFRTAPMLAPRVADVTTFAPWPWEFGPRTYLVWAVRFRTGKEVRS